MRDTISVRHEPDRQRFVAMIQGADDEAVLDYRPHGDRTLEYYHTFTPRSLRGRGIAGQLVAFALDYASQHDYRVAPTCPFVRKIIRGDAKYAALAVAERGA